MIIDEATLRAKCRFFSNNIDFARSIEPILNEVIQLDIKPQLGDRMVYDILTAIENEGKVQTMEEMVVCDKVYSTREVFNWETYENDIVRDEFLRDENCRKFSSSCSVTYEHTDSDFNEDKSEWYERAVVTCPNQFTELLEGGQFTDECGNLRIFEGLQKAIAYYTYARMLRNPNGFLTPTGFRQSEDTYSSYVEMKERESTIIAVKEAADSYMADCIAYLMATPELGYCESNPKKSRESSFFVIGE